MMMRRKVARAFRKLADLIDPTVRPSEVMTIRIECDTSEFEKAMAAATRKLEMFRDLAKDPATAWMTKPFGVLEHPGGAQ